MELETNVGRSSSEDQQHYSIATCKHKRTIKSPTSYAFEDLVSYALIVRPEKFQFLEKWQNRDFDQKSGIYSLDLG